MERRPVWKRIMDLETTDWSGGFVMAFILRNCKHGRSEGSSAGALVGLTALAIATVTTTFTPANGQAGGGGGGGAGGAGASTTGPGMTAGSGPTAGTGPTAGSGSTTGTGPTRGTGQTAGTGATSGTGSTTGTGATTGTGSTQGTGVTAGFGQTTGPGATTGLGLTFGSTTGFSPLATSASATNFGPALSGQSVGNILLPLQITNASTLGQFPGSNFAIGTSAPEFSNFTTTFPPEANLRSRIFETQISQFAQMNSTGEQDADQAASKTGRSPGIQTFGVRTPRTRNLNASVQEIIR